VEGQARVRELAEEALVHATRACELKPDELTHPSNQSEALRLLGRREEALDSILRAEALAPHMPEFRWMRGRLLEELGRLDEARGAYLSAADDPRDRRHELDAVRGMLSIAVKRKDYADAIVQGRRLVQLVPGDADAVANLGALLVASGDASGGRAEYLRALTGDAGFSSERAFMTTAIRYLRAAIATTLDEREAQVARALAEQLASDAPGDPMLRFIQLALAVTRGDLDAKGAIEQMEREARAANAVEFADELAAFLRAH
jgi:Flp pilus assembly protein TadD